MWDDRFRKGMRVRYANPHGLLYSYLRDEYGVVIETPAPEDDEVRVEWLGTPYGSYKKSNLIVTPSAEF